MAKEIEVSILAVKVLPELHDLVMREVAERYPGGTSDFITPLIAKYFNRKDLAKVPRKKMGRPAKRLHLDGRASA